MFVLKPENKSIFSIQRYETFLYPVKLKVSYRVTSLFLVTYGNHDIPLIL